MICPEGASLRDEEDTTIMSTDTLPRSGPDRSARFFGRIVMAAAALLTANASPSDEDIAPAITNICRCGTYPRVRGAIRRAAREEKRVGVWAYHRHPTIWFALPERPSPPQFHLPPVFRSPARDPT